MHFRTALQRPRSPSGVPWRHPRLSIPLLRGAKSHATARKEVKSCLDFTLTGGGDAEEPFGPFPGPPSFRGLGIIFLPGPGTSGLRGQSFWSQLVQLRSRAILPLCVGWLVPTIIAATSIVLVARFWLGFS